MSKIISASRSVKARSASARLRVGMVGGRGGLVGVVSRCVRWLVVAQLVAVSTSMRPTVCGPAGTKGVGRREFARVSGAAGAAAVSAFSAASATGATGGGAEGANALWYVPVAGDVASRPALAYAAVEERFYLRLHGLETWRVVEIALS